VGGGFACTGRFSGGCCSFEHEWAANLDGGSEAGLEHPRIHTTCKSPGGATHNQKNNVVCRELAHTVGFSDGGNNQASCITSGENSRLRSWESSKVNGEC